MNNQAALYLPVDKQYDETAALSWGAQMPAHVTEDERDYQRLQTWGANVVRWGMDWHWFQGQSKEAAYAVVDKHVAWAKAHGIWLIPVMYIPQGGGMDYATNLGFWGSATTFDAANMTAAEQSLRDFWAEFATRYANEPGIAGFDLLNEPSTPHPHTVWMPYARYLRDQIRTVDRNHFVVLESGPDGQFLDSDLLPAHDVVYSVHDYVPGSMTNDPDGNYTYPGPAPDYDGTTRMWNKATLVDVLKTEGRLPITWSIEHNVPLFVGEFGSLKNTTGYAHLIADDISLMNSWGIHWAEFLYRDYSTTPNADFGLVAAPSAVKSMDARPDTTLIQALRSGLAGAGAGAPATGDVARHSTA